ncbi:MAG: serine protease [Synergistaceae bacterium]|nr:serine protease [Synergistaceae bacterium]
MTPEEACLYLGISLDDDDIDIDKLERNYEAKISEYKDSENIRAKINEAYDVLLEVLAEIYEPEETVTDEPERSKNEGLLMKIAVLMAGMFLLCFGGVVYFVYRIQTENAAPKDDVVSAKQYESIKRELEAIRQRQEKTPTPQVVINNPPADYAQLVERVMPSILFIQTDKGRGSGFFVSPNGDILTNYHVIESAEYISVTTQYGQTVTALVKDFDSVKDIALLKVNTSYTVPFLKISNVLPKQGEAVIAIGNPEGLKGTVSNGIVSALRQDDRNLWVQFTAPISPGSSGGALINLQGEVVGMPAKILVTEVAQNLNFAVAPTALAQFLNSAINKPAITLTAKTVIPPKTNVPPKTKMPPNKGNTLDGIPGVKFVRKDDEYEMYLAEDSIEYNRQTHIASFATFWLPSEKAKAKMLRDPHFVVSPGEELGVCLLGYLVNLRDNTYVHLRTVNFCTNGNVARDYVKPSDEIKWRTAKKGSRIESLMREVKKQLRLR